MTLYHCTTPKKLKQYEATGAIFAPVRGWKYLESATEWGKRTGRSIIVKFESNKVYKLPDHKPKGHAFWADENIHTYECIKMTQ